MIHLLLIPLVLVVSLAFGQSNEAEKSTKHNISIGMFDDRTGISLVGYTYNVRQTDMDEFFTEVLKLIEEVIKQNKNLDRIIV